MTFLKNDAGGTLLGEQKKGRLHRPFQTACGANTLSKGAARVPESPNGL